MERTDYQSLIGMLDKVMVGYGTRTDYIDGKSPGCSVQVEHPDDDGNGFWVTEWSFDSNGHLLSVEHYRGESG